MFAKCGPHQSTQQITNAKHDLSCIMTAYFKMYPRVAVRNSMRKAELYMIEKWINKSNYFLERICLQRHANNLVLQVKRI